jgi:hypothetical protein
MTAAALLPLDHTGRPTDHDDEHRRAHRAAEGPTPLVRASEPAGTLDDALRALARGWAGECLVCGARLEHTMGPDVECSACGSCVARSPAAGDDQLALL